MNVVAFRETLINIRPQTISLSVVEYIEHNVAFNEIQDTIVQGIRNAKYLIWAAVAWFLQLDSKR